MSESSIYRGGCHCGLVAYEVRGPLENLTECNCSICAKKGYLHWIVERERFRLLTPWENLATYTFNTKTAQHHFCPRCGVAPLYIPRSDPDKIDVNVLCLEEVDLESLTELSSTDETRRIRSRDTIDSSLARC